MAEIEIIVSALVIGWGRGQNLSPCSSLVHTDTSMSFSARVSKGCTTL